MSDRRAKPLGGPEADLLAGRRVVLGVSGSIACYKSLTLAGGLAQRGAEVDVVLTSAASRLVSPMAFQALIHRPAVTSLWEPTSALGMDHLTLARGAEIVVVAPATAHLLAQMALGLAPDALTTTLLATTAPVLVAPAMETNMWRHAAARAHVATLVERGVRFVGPDTGRLASGAVGEGRMAEPAVILDAVVDALVPSGPWRGRRVLVTAGPTREPLDPVRFLSNRSTGRMGFAVAGVARSLGAHVELVSGPVSLPDPPGVHVTRVERAAEMRDRVLAAAPSCDLVVLAAAVSDFAPAHVATGKLKKADGAPELDLQATPDIAAELHASLRETSGRPIIVGFAAESEEVRDRAREKASRKGFDLILGNRVPDAFGDGAIHGWLIDEAGEVELAGLDKRAAARAILERAATLLPPDPSGAEATAQYTAS